MPNTCSQLSGLYCQPYKLTLLQLLSKIHPNHTEKIFWWSDIQIKYNYINKNILKAAARKELPSD